jgi:thiol-disulfide isomerase/thioredoxin
MMSALRIFLALAALVSCVVMKIGSSPMDGVTPSLSKVFPDLSGNPHLMSEWKGKVLIVNFWATWCQSCVEELPELTKLQTELEPQGVQFIGILIEDEAKAAQEFLNSHVVNFPILNGTKGGRQWSRKLGDNAEALPFSVVFDIGGKPVYTEIGQFPREKILTVINSLL